MPLTAQEKEVNRFNKMFPIGSEVIVQLSDGSLCTTSIREEAIILPGNITRCRVRAKDGYTRLDNIYPITGGEAKAVDAQPVEAQWPGATTSAVA